MRDQNVSNRRVMGREGEWKGSTKWYIYLWGSWNCQPDISRPWRILESFAASRASWNENFCVFASRPNHLPYSLLHMRLQLVALRPKCTPSLSVGQKEQLVLAVLFQSWHPSRALFSVHFPCLKFSYLFSKLPDSFEPHRQLWVPRGQQCSRRVLP